MSFFLPPRGWDNCPGPTVWDRLTQVFQHKNDVVVLDCEKLIHIDASEVEGILSASNKATCRYFWKRWIGAMKREMNDSHPGWSIVSSFVHRFDDGMNTNLLLLALRENKTDLARKLISMGTNLAGWNENGRHQLSGPAQRLFYSQTLSRSDAYCLGKMMLDRGAIGDLNTGGIIYKELVQLFLEYAPHPDDKAGWLALKNSPHKVVQYQCRRFSEMDKENIPLLLAAGYPANHTDLLARAITAGRNDIAHDLLDWEGFDPHGTNGIPYVRGEGPEVIGPSTFWYFIVDFWMSSYGAGLANKTPQSEWKLHWPDENLFSRLMDIPALDVDAIHPSTGYTAASLCDGWDYGCPLLLDRARWKRGRLLEISGQREIHRAPLPVF